MSSCDCLQYIVCHVGNWGDLKRTDSLARIARAGLASGSTLNILHQDSVMLTLYPDFMGHGKPWGSATKATSEAQLRALLQQIHGGKKVQGATLMQITEPWSYSRKVRHIMQSVVRDCTEVWSLSENGEDLLCDGMSPAPRRAATSLLVALGGVRDMNSVEKRVLAETCQVRGLKLCIKSLGSTPELTSKCIKFLEVAKDLDLLGRGPVANATMAEKPIASPLHVIVYLNNALHEYIKTPAAATLLVDLFLSSHSRCEATSLSLVGKDRKVVVLRDCTRQRRPRMPPILGDGLELDARQFLTEASGGAWEYQGLQELLVRELRESDHGLEQLHVLHADKDAPRLDRIAGLHAVSDAVVPVAVVFAPSWLQSEIKPLRGAVAACVDANIGHWSSSAAFVRVVHNANRLASVIQTTSGDRVAKSIKAHEKQAESESSSTASVGDASVAKIEDLCEDSDDEGLDEGRSVSALHDFITAQRSYRLAVRKALLHSNVKIPQAPSRR